MSEPTRIYGQSGAGPLNIAAYEEQPGWVHIGWGDGGMYLDGHQVRQLVRALEAAAAVSEGVMASGASMREMPGTALAEWARRVMHEPLPTSPAAARAALSPLEEWSRRWHALDEVDQHDLPRVGPGSVHELELLDGLIAELREIAGGEKT